MLNDYEYYLGRLNNIFDKKFKAHSKLLANRDISNYMPDIYNRWLYSVCEKNLCVTPANIFMALAQNSNIFPAIKSCSEKKVTLAPASYSIENHPIISDLTFIIQNFVPIYDLDLGFNLNDENVKYVLSNLSIYEINYLEYLKIVCLQLNLFQIMPSIHCKRLCLSDTAENFLKKSPDEIFELVFDATVQIFCEHLCSLVNVDDNSAVYDFAMDLFLLYDLPISKLISEILFYFGLDEKSFKITSDHNFFYDFIYFLNITLNRFFFLPFGHYLKLILPMYSTPFNLNMIINLLKKHLDENQDVYRIFDFADTKFMLTELGKSFLEIDAPNLSGRLTKNEIDYLINNFDCVNEEDYPVAHSLTNYKFKIEIDESPQYWKTIDCSGEMKLHEFFLTICREFLLPADSFYNFVIDTPFSDAKKISLNQIKFSSGEIFYLILHNQINYYAINNSKLIENRIKIKIHVHKSETATKNILFNYKTCRQSKSFANFLFIS